jgi:hypothetical protein
MAFAPACAISTNREKTAEKPVITANIILNAAMKGLYGFLCQFLSGTAILAVFLHGLEARATN